MIRIKMLAKNELYVIDDGWAYKFDIGGRCIEERVQVTDKIMTGMTEVPIISVLSSRDNTCIALFQNNEMQEYIADMPAMMCAVTLQRNGGYIRMLRRDGMENNIRFNQMLFLYPDGTNLMSKLSGFKFKEEK